MDIQAEYTEFVMVSYVATAFIMSFLAVFYVSRFSKRKKVIQMLQATQNKD